MGSTTEFNRQQRTAGDLCGLGAVICVGRKRRAAAQAGHDLIDVVFRDGEQHRHGLELGDDHDAASLAGSDDIADIDQTDASAAVNRGDDVGIAQVDAGGFHIGLVGDHDAFVGLHQGFLGRHLLLSDGVLLHQGLIARQVHLGVGEVGGIAGQLAARLVQRSLVGTRVDLGQGIAGLHHLAFDEVQFHQHAADLRSHRSRGKRRHRAQRIQCLIDVAIDGLGYAHRLGALIDKASAARRFGGINRPDQKPQ